MATCPQCGGLVEKSKETRTIFRKGELFKERHTWLDCIDCRYFEESTDSEKIATVTNNNKKGYG